MRLLVISARSNASFCQRQRKSGEYSSVSKPVEVVEVELPSRRTVEGLEGPPVHRQRTDKGYWERIRARREWLNGKKFTEVSE